jgi:hypothetical protein
MPAPNLGATGAPGNSPAISSPGVPCPNHAAVTLPRLFACPLCAQEARQRAYAAQRAIGAASVAQAPRRPASPGAIPPAIAVRSTPFKLAAD